jgi:hypothetical protein
LVAAKANDLELELVEKATNSVDAEFNKSAEYRKLNPQGKIPTFVGANGFVLTEAIAIAIYGTYPLCFFLPFSHTAGEFTMMSLYTLQLSLAELQC